MYNPKVHWFHFGEEYHYLGPDRSGPGKPTNRVDKIARLHDRRYDRSAHHPRGARGLYRAGADALAGLDMVSSGTAAGITAGTGLILQSLVRGATLGFIEFPWD